MSRYPEHDPADAELARRLLDVAPEAGDADAVLAGLRPRFARARRRRQAGFVASGVLAVLVCFGVGLAAVDGRNPHGRVEVPPASRSHISPSPTTVDNPTATTEPTATDRAEHAAPSTAADGSGPSGGPTTPTTGTGSDDGGGDNHGAGSGSSGPGSGSSGPGSGGSGSGSEGSGSGSSGPGPSGSGSSGSGSGS